MTKPLGQRLIITTLDEPREVIADARITTKKGLRMEFPRPAKEVQVALVSDGGAYTIVVLFR